MYIRMLVNIMGSSNAPAHYLNQRFEPIVAISARTSDEAQIKLTNYFMAESDIPLENRKFVLNQFSLTMQVRWVRWQEHYNDEGEKIFGWCLTEGNHWGESGYERVYVAKPDDHFFQWGHHKELILGENGHSINGVDCSTCKLEEALEGKLRKGKHER